MSFLLPLFMSSGGGTIPPPIIVNELSAFRSIAVQDEEREVYIQPMDDFTSGTSEAGTVNPETRTYLVGVEDRTVTVTLVERVFLVQLENRVIFA